MKNNYKFNLVSGKLSAIESCKKDNNYNIYTIQTESKTVYVHENKHRSNYEINSSVNLLTVSKLKENSPRYSILNIGNNYHSYSSIIKLFHKLELSKSFKKNVLISNLLIITFGILLALISIEYQNLVHTRPMKKIENVFSIEHESDPKERWGGGPTTKHTLECVNHIQEDFKLNNISQASEKLFLTLSNSEDIRSFIKKHKSFRNFEINFENRGSINQFFRVLYSFAVYVHANNPVLSAQCFSLFFVYLFLIARSLLINKKFKRGVKVLQTEFKKALSDGVHMDR